MQQRKDVKSVCNFFAELSLFMKWFIDSAVLEELFLFV